MEKLYRYFIVTFCVVLLGTMSCKDDDLVIVPEWETAVHGLGTFADGSPQNFVFQNPDVQLDVNLRWISIDQKNTVTKIELYVLFNEEYIDADGNPAVAKHGGDDGVLFQTIEGGAVPANRQDIMVSFSQTELFGLYQNAEFDYTGLGTKVNVFENPAKPERADNAPFVKGDGFQVKWVFTTEDGREFNFWGVSVCTEFPGANCAVNWGVICESDLAGTYDVVSTFVSPGYFSSASPDFQYGPGNDGSVQNGVQTYEDVVVEEGSATSTYNITDITNGFEPIMWGNPAVSAIVADQCGALVLSELTWDGPYGYEIKAGSKVNEDGSLTIVWQNIYGENGVSTFTPK